MKRENVCIKSLLIRTLRPRTKMPKNHCFFEWFDMFVVKMRGRDKNFSETNEWLDVNDQFRLKTNFLCINKFHVISWKANKRKIISLLWKWRKFLSNNDYFLFSKIKVQIWIAIEIMKSHKGQMCWNN